MKKVIIVGPFLHFGYFLWFRRTIFFLVKSHSMFVSVFILESISYPQKLPPGIDLDFIINCELILKHALLKLASLS